MTEAERLVIQRIGQDVFRDALMAYWGGRCPLTGITEPGLLRASHIVPWADCTDAQRLDVHNGLLLSALWDAAFDRFRRGGNADDESRPADGVEFPNRLLVIVAVQHELRALRLEDGRKSPCVAKPAHRWAPRKWRSSRCLLAPYS